MRPLSFVFCALSAALFSAGSVCAQTPESVEGVYRVGVGDLLKVEAFPHDEISGEYLVEEDGSIKYPLVGSVPVANDTTSQIASRLEFLLEKDYYVDVQLHVEVADYRSQPVTVLGEVQRPGTYYLEGPTTLTQLLAATGGLKPTAGPVLELRRVARVDDQTDQDVLTFSTSKILTGEEGSDVAMRRGDVVSVSARQLYFVTGEVARPGQYEISPGMTLMQAISQAGGQGKFASQTIELHRDDAGEKTILTFDLSRIRKGKMADPPIQRGDVIIVRRRLF
jgi:polysaccharide export outer membrane protein